MVAEADFDAIARPYRWLEYFTLGRALERAREHFLSRLGCSRRALVLGDGDGRFTARLLVVNPTVHVEAVDTSAAMLGLLRQRVRGLGHEQRLSTRKTSALSHEPQLQPDLIATHFFLDCLGQAEVETLVTRLAFDLAPAGLWVVSDFRIPVGRMRTPARLFVRALYFAFRVLTGLRTKALPDHESVFRRAGLVLVGEHYSLLGLLSSELWQKPAQH